MDNSFYRQESDVQKKGNFSASLHIFDSILTLMRHSINRLAGLIRLTEEEQEAAGIYLGRLEETNKYQTNIQ